MMSLILTPNLADADGVYADILAAHEGLCDAQSAALNARLILILANHIGDAHVLRHAISEAQATARQG